MRLGGGRQGATAGRRNVVAYEESILEDQLWMGLIDGRIMCIIAS